jgi:hypothetical protein
MIDISLLGFPLALAGAIISIVGNLLNTIRKMHRLAIGLWTVSSFLIAVWGTGYMLGIWRDGLAVAAITGMNVIFLISNVYGLVRRSE